MKSMREMISLMEGVMAVPGLNEKSTSEKQARTMAAAAHNPEFAKKVGISQDVAKEFNKADTGTKQLSNALKEDTESDMQTAGTVGRNASYAEFDATQTTTESVPAVDSCQQGNPADAVVACAMGENVSDLIYDQQYSRFSDLMNSFVEPQEAFDVLSREMAEQGIEGEEHDAIMQRLESDFFPDDSAFDMANGPDDFSDDAEALASAGHGSDEDYGEFPMDEDIKNGYDDVNFANGSDFFPNGADSPVVRAVGPSGARQGDNPEQKKMQVAEVHKELVYGYRNFLKEEAQATQKKKLTESAQVADIQVTEFHDNPHASGDSITFDGSIDLSATAIGKNGQPIEIGFSVDVKAEAGLGWESDESPTGWNYKTDNPTYTSHDYATSGDISVTSVQFTDGAEYYINNEAVELQEFYQHFDPVVLKQLLNPEIYVKALGSAFDKSVENLEPPEQEFDEPERDYGDSRY